MKKNGFTLIELLAVIIILAVIALIATPLVLDVVDDARSQARKNSIFGYAEAVKLGVYEHQFKNDGENPTIDEDWLTTNVVTKGDTVTCEKVTFHETKGVLLSGCTVGSDETLYYYDGNNVLTSEPDNFEDYFETEQTPSVTYKCKRVTGVGEDKLHTETCSRTSNYCYAAGYVSGSAKGTTIEYGKIKELGTDLESGDALNCDLNGDNIFDPVTERFYYVSSLYDTAEKEFDDEYAVLIYYTNTLNGSASTSGAAYETSGLYGENWHGPVVAATHLPTVESWTNVSLKSTTRQILNQNDGNTTTGGTLGTFSYTKSDGTAYAARLLTYKEVVTACGNGSTISTGYLNEKCEYLMENTKYSSSSMSTNGQWLETPHSSYTYFVWNAYGYTRTVNHSNASNRAELGVRPAIEVLKTEILH